MPSPQRLPIVQTPDSHAGTSSDWWRSLEELSEAPDFQSQLHREFPENATELGGSSRREFLRLMSASLLLAGAVGCNIKQPQEKIVPAARQTGHSKPGLPTYYTTAMDFAGSAIGLTVECRDGRPIKIEGNANHPSNLGTSSVFAQAATLDLYDADRLKAPTLDGNIDTLDRLRSEIDALRKQFDATEGKGLRVLIGTTTSPTRARLLKAMTDRWPQSKWYVYESIHDDQPRAGLAKAYGESAHSAQAIYDFSQSKVILSIDYDFLAARDLPPTYIRQFADARRIAGSDNDAKRSMVRLYHLGSSPTPTSAKADHALSIRPSRISNILRQIAEKLEVETASSAEGNADDQATDWIESLVRDLRQAGKSAMVVVGREQPSEIHALAHAINEKLGAVGTTVNFIESLTVRPPNAASDRQMIQQLTSEMHRGEVDSLLILDGNPVFDAPADLAFQEAMGKTPLTLALTPSRNETSVQANWAVPRSHFLEAWSDARAHDGTASIVQPMIDPLHESLSEIELLALLVSDSASGYDAIRKTWADTLGTTDEDLRWQKALSQGVIPETQTKKVSLTLDREAAKLSTAQAKQGGFDIVIKPDPSLWDGRFANNGWLQELPKPLTHVVWDNAAWIAPGDAERLQLSQGDLVQIGEAAVEVPVWIVPGQASGCVTLFTGYGREFVGRVGRSSGFDVQPMRTMDHTTQILNVAVAKTGRSYALATTQHFQTMEGRHLARAGTLDEYLDNKESPEFAHPPSPSPEASFYEQWSYDGHKWGMTIDLTACVGCSACVIACQAENNIPVVGKKQVQANRHMHWIRVDTYYQGPPDAPSRTLTQPVPCMHCENAPCEIVCPVAATTHSDEGLNQMVYNRCVGTRYCSNNCPYKVRRFNFLDFSDDFITDPTLELLSNPEVTLRSRGVMEKCTYCVQRIEHARIAAQLENRPIRDGDIKTACQSACPAQAIRFGDLNDASSQVRQTHDHPLNYALLEELNTKPRTTYLAEVDNP